MSKGRERNDPQDPQELEASSVGIGFCCV